MAAKRSRESNKESEEPQEKKLKSEEISTEPQTNGLKKKKKRRSKKKPGEKMNEPQEKKVKSEEISTDPQTNGLQKKKKRRSKKKSGEKMNGQFTILKNIPQIPTAAPVILVHPLLKDPYIIPQDGTLPLEDCDWLSQSLQQKMMKQGMTMLFPVQTHVVPHILETQRCFQLFDVCVSAPTGSGKTLAYVLPIVQNLTDHRCFQAVVVVPTRELAVQVHRVFKAYLPPNLKVELATTSQDFEEEQRNLVENMHFQGIYLKPQVLVATPGRLIEHIQKTEGFQLDRLHYLVLDEADRILDSIKGDWIETLQKTITSKRCRKFLLSATLFQDIALLDRVSLNKPKFFSYKGGISSQMKQQEDEESLAVATPPGLEEYYVRTTLQNRALTLHTLIKSKGMEKVLCFARSKEDCHRLTSVLKSMGGIGKVAEFSSELGKKRKAVFRNFADGTIDVLVATTSMERGIDLDVKYVILYSPPDNITDYIHEVGRTARAGGTGVAITLTTGEEKDFFKMMKKAKKLPAKLTLDPEDIKQAQPAFKKALESLSTQIQKEKKSKFKTHH